MGRGGGGGAPGAGQWDEAAGPPRFESGGVEGGAGGGWVPGVFRRRRPGMAERLVRERGSEGRAVAAPGRVGWRGGPAGPSLGAGMRSSPQRAVRGRAGP